MDWLKGLFTSPEKNKEVEMKGSPEEEQRVRQQQIREQLKNMEEDMKELKKDSIERLQKEIKYNELSYQLNRGMIPEKVYNDEIMRLKKLLGEKMAQQEQKDWNEAGAAAPGDHFFSSFGGGKRKKSKKAKAKSKKAKAKSKKAKRSKTKSRSKKQSRK